MPRGGDAIPLVMLALSKPESGARNKRYPVIPVLPAGGVIENVNASSPVLLFSDKLGGESKACIGNKLRNKPTKIKIDSNVRLYINKGMINTNL